MSWLTEDVGPGPMVKNLIGEIAALLIDDRRLRGDDPHQGTSKRREFRSAGIGLGHSLCPHHESDSPAAGVTFVHNTDSGVAAAKAAAGAKFVSILGAHLAQMCLEEDLLDEIFVCIAPVLRGDGIRLFARPGGTQVKLERLDLTHTPRAMNLWLRVVG